MVREECLLILLFLVGLVLLMCCIQAIVKSKKEHKVLMKQIEDQLGLQKETQLDLQKKAKQDWVSMIYLKLKIIQQQVHLLSEISKEREP